MAILTRDVIVSSHFWIARPLICCNGFRAQTRAPALSQPETHRLWIDGPLIALRPSKSRRKACPEHHFRTRQCLYPTPSYTGIDRGTARIRYPELRPV